MGLWDKIKQWIVAKPDTLPRKWDPELQPFDADWIANSLRLKEEGFRLGEVGVPPVGQFTLAGPEAAAIAAVESVRADYLEWSQRLVKATEDEFGRISIEQTLRTATDSAEEFVRLVDQDITNNATELGHLQQVAASRQKAYLRFRKTHRREDVPHFPVGVNLAFWWVFAVFLVVVEAAVNMSFFAQGLRGGLIAGFFQAFIAAGFNVAAGLAIGRIGIPFINHVQPSYRLGGWIALGVALAIMLALALGVAHYREALMHGAASAQSEAIKSFVSSPFGLMELSSWLLFAVSMGFGIIALFDGYKMSDPYPGYKKVYVKWQEAEAAYRSGVQQLRDHINKKKEETLKRIDGTAAQIQGAIVRMRELINTKAKGRERIGNQLLVSQQWIDLVLKTFQTANIEARMAKGHPTPDRFLRPPEVSLLPMDFPDFDTSRERAVLEKYSLMVNEFLQQLPALRSKIQSAYNQRSNALETLDQQFSRQEVSNISAIPAAVATPHTALTARE
jgi:hypothetical protein